MAHNYFVCVSETGIYFINLLNDFLVPLFQKSCADGPARLQIYKWKLLWKLSNLLSVPLAPVSFMAHTAAIECANSLTFEIVQWQWDPESFWACGMWIELCLWLS